MHRGNLHFYIIISLSFQICLKNISSTRPLSWIILFQKKVLCHTISTSQPTGTDNQPGGEKTSKCMSGEVTSWHSWEARAGCNPEAEGWTGSELPRVRWSSLWGSCRTDAHTDAWGTHEEHLTQCIGSDLPAPLIYNVMYSLKPN